MNLQKINNQPSFGYKKLQFDKSIVNLPEKTLKAIYESLSEPDFRMFGFNDTNLLVSAHKETNPDGSFYFTKQMQVTMYKIKTTILKRLFRRSKKIEEIEYSYSDYAQNQINNPYQVKNLIAEVLKKGNNNEH
jgi:hypothetical protein